MISCGVDVGLRAQHLCTLDASLTATFDPPGNAAAVAAKVLALGPDVVVGIDAPSGGSLQLLAAGAPLRTQLGITGERYLHARVCDWQLMRRGLPLYPSPPAGEQPVGWQAWMGEGHALFAALEALGRYSPPPDERCEGPARPGHGRVFETFPDAAFCALAGRRPSPKRTREGRDERVTLLERAGVRDPAGLPSRSLHELDACAAALVAHRFAAGGAGWVGDPREGVIVVPVPELADRYAPLSRVPRGRSSP
jgi:predicted nuclease with RNAse H fold